METANPPSVGLTSGHSLHRVWPNRIFAFTYTTAIFAIFYRHATKLLHPTAPATAVVTAILFLADAILAFMWLTVQSFRIFIFRWEEHPENLAGVFSGDKEFPALDVFICTADPYKEPPIGVVNTVLSVMAYEYPKQKVSIYVSDDGGSDLTLFALMEAAEFAKEWIPFCRREQVMERSSPEAYFASASRSSGDDFIKTVYESMKVRVEEVMERGEVADEYVTRLAGRKALSRWTDKTFTSQEHPAIVEVLSHSSKDRDVEGHPMPNLIYVSREKKRSVQHHFKAGALNTLLRVSATLSNGPIILTLDCDMTSNDPYTPHRALCHFYDSSPDHSILAYVQFPQRFKGINKDDIYNGEYKSIFYINPMGMTNGPDYFGTGCFFRRRSLFGSPTTTEMEELSPEHVVTEPTRYEEVVQLAHHVASCDYETNTKWGSKIGFRYGSLVEDYFTGYQLQCDGWKSRFCHPERAAFLGDAPISLIDTLIQQKRWVIGLYEIAFSRYNPMTFGLRNMGPFMGLSYAHYAVGPSWCIPLAIYAFVPPLALIHGTSIFPKISEPWFFVYLFLFFGAYAQDLVNFMLAGHGSTIRRWWNHQRMWLILGLTSQLFGTIDYALKLLGISEHSFSVTNKINDEEQSKRYEEGVFDFGATSPMLVLLSTVATINIVSFGQGLFEVALKRRRWEVMEGLMVQIMLVGFVVLNCWPLYGAMLVRRDKGRVPTALTLASGFLASLLYVVASP